MAYKDFTLDSIEEKLFVKNKYERLFPTIIPKKPSEWLINALITAHELPLRTEKAKSELIVMPILIELRNQNDKYFTVYSGENLNVDSKIGLKGECDFILAKDIHTVSINYPIIQIVEAKKNDIDLGLPQCAAQLIGAKIFNERKGVILKYVYGCVTTGDEWLFLRLNENLQVDTQKYFLNEIEELLGVFQYIIDYFKTELH